MYHQIPNTYLSKPPTPTQSPPFRDTGERHGKARFRAVPVIFRGAKEYQFQPKAEPPPSLLSLAFVDSTHHERAMSAPSPSCPQETVPKPFHNTRQMARQTDGPFTQASRNRQGPARMRTWGQMELRQGGALLPGLSSPGLGEEEPGSRNTNRRLVSMTQEEATVRMGMI